MLLLGGILLAVFVVPWPWGVFAVLAAAWFLERTAGFANPAAGPVAWLSAHPILLLVTLALSAMVARAMDRAPRTT